MESWWELGEWRGKSGRELAIYQIACAFCFEKGNFSVAFNARKKKANDEKVLNFTTLKCENCAGYVMVLWSPTSSFLELHDYIVLPYVLKAGNVPQEWPEEVSRYWLQAHKTLIDENWDAAAVMSRSALQVAFREKGAVGKNLKQEIDDLGSKGLIPPVIIEWSHEVRELGNDSAHPKPGQPPTSGRDAGDIVRFMDYLFRYLYTIPHEIEQYRNRKDQS